jgi:hypothetical protein
LKAGATRPIALRATANAADDRRRGFTAAPDAAIDAGKSE